METLGDRVRLARKRCGLSQPELAQRVHSSINALSMLEVGTITDPHISRMIQLATVLGVSIDYLVGLEEGTCKS